MRHGLRWAVLAAGFTACVPAGSTDSSEETDQPPPETEAPDVGNNDIGIYNNYACALHERRGVWCWGGERELDDTDPTYMSDPTEETPTGLTGVDLIVGNVAGIILTDGHMIGWYQFISPAEPDWFQPPAVSMSDSAGETCWIRTDHSIVCLEHPVVDATPPAGNDFTKVIWNDRSAGALRADGSLVFWADPQAWEGFPLDGSWRDFAMSVFTTCGIRITGEIICTTTWPELYAQLTERVPPPGTWKEIEVSACSACALDEGGYVTCWQVEGCIRDQTPPPVDGGYIALAVHAHTGCAMKPDGFVTCWGDNVFGERDVEQGPPLPD
jgi:hypothetical protein